MYNISKKDKEILYNLDINSRKPLRKIARDVNLPEKTLRYRIKKLEEKHENEKREKKYLEWSGKNESQSN